MIDFSFALTLPCFTIWKSVVHKKGNISPSVRYWLELYSTNDVFRISLSLGRWDNSFSFGLFGFVINGEVYREMT